MSIDKFYFYKTYDQWKGKILSIHDIDENVEIYNYQMYFIDIDTSKVVSINAVIQSSNDTIYDTECLLVNTERRIVELPLILSLLDKDALYKVTFTLTLSDNTTVDSNVQTFRMKENYSGTYSNESPSTETSYFDYDNYTRDTEDYSFIMLDNQLIRVDKIYMHRKYNQWRGKPLFVEDEDKKNGIYIQFTDLEMARGSINIIYAEIRDINGGVYSIGSTIEDYDKKLVKFILPNEVISNDGLYEITFGVAYNTEGTEEVITYRSAIQTFNILDTVESSDSEVIQESHYPILLQLIEEISGYKVDTSNFPTYTDVQEMIGEKFDQVSIEVILKTLNDKGYITKTQLDKILIGQFVMKSELSNYVSQIEFKSAVTWTRFLNEYDKYYLRQKDLDNYVKKEEGKGLSTHDLTDELYEKIINGNSELSQDVIDRLKTFVTKEQFKQEMTQYLNTFYATFYTKAEINEKFAIYYTKEEIEQMFLTIDNFNIEKEELIQKIDEAITPIELEEYGYLTNDDVNDVLEDYYNKEQIDNLLQQLEQSGLGQELLDKINNATSRAEVNELLLNYATKEDLKDLDIDIDLSDYYTKTEIDNTFITKDDIGNFDFNVDLSDYYTKTESDTKFATKNEIVKIDDETPSLNTTYSSEVIEQKIIGVDDNVLDLETRVEYLEDKQMDIINFDGSYNSLTGKPTIPSLDGYATEDYVDEAIKNLDINQEDIDLTGYAKTEDIPTKTSQLTNDSGFLTSIPSEYITDEELDDKGYLTEHQDLSSYATKTYVTEEIAKAQLEGEDIDLSAYAKKTDLHSHTNKTILDNITADKVTSWDNKSNFSGNYNDLTNKPEGLATTNYVDTEVDDATVFETDILTVSDLGGISANTDLNGLTVKEILSKLLYPYIEPVVTVTGTPNGGTYEKGNTQTITNVKVVVTKKSEKITKIEVLNGSTSLAVQEDDAIANGGTFNYAVNVSVPSTNKQLTINVTDASENVVTKKTSSFTFIYPYYWGVCDESAVITDTLVKGLTKSVTSKGTKVVEYTTDNQKMIFAYPKSYGVVKKVLDANSFDVTSTFTKEEIAIKGLDGTNQVYYVYTNSASTVTSFKMTFSY